jgi:hypothetical protein
VIVLKKIMILYTQKGGNKIDILIMGVAMMMFRRPVTRPVQERKPVIAAFLGRPCDAFTYFHCQCADIG